SNKLKLSKQYKKLLFRWALSPMHWPLPNLEVSNAVVEKATDYALVWINRLLVVGHDITIKTDRKMILILWLYFWINVWIYNAFSDQVDEKVGPLFYLFLFVNVVNLRTTNANHTILIYLLLKHFALYVLEAQIT
ncbi:hypothetical protein ACJX0J_031855, partial [Zea mays]